jgi:hypothetical protein
MSPSLYDQRRGRRRRRQRGRRLDPIHSRSTLHHRLAPTATQHTPHTWQHLLIGTTPTLTLSRNALSPLRDAMSSLSPGLRRLPRWLAPEGRHTRPAWRRRHVTGKSALRLCVRGVRVCACVCVVRCWSVRDGAITGSMHKRNACWGD